MMTFSEPCLVSGIAAEAAVSPNTTWDHLRRPIDFGVVTATEQTGTRHYYRNPLYTRLRDVRELLDDTTKRRLSEQAASLNDDIAAQRAEYDADSPDALRERAAVDDVSAERAHELTRTASDWELARYRFSLVQDALANYDTWMSDRSQLTV